MNAHRGFHSQCSHTLLPEGRVFQRKNVSPETALARLPFSDLARSCNWSELCGWGVEKEGRREGGVEEAEERRRGGEPGGEQPEGKH